MNWELLLALGTSAAFLLFAFLYAKARVGAAKAETYRAQVGHLTATVRSQDAIIAQKELYIRDIEKTLLEGLPAAKLVKRLNDLFKANGGGKARPVPAGDTSPGTADD